VAAALIFIGFESFYFLNDYLSYPLIPSKVNESQMSFVFTCLSKIEELLKLGMQFTSSTQGFKVSSKIISKP
jgi:hypothetical protein